MSITIEEIAKEAEVSHTAVSLVLNNKYHGRVSEVVKNRIMAKVKEYEFRPHGMARGLALNKTHNIGVAIYDFYYLSEPFFATIISEVGRWTAELDYNLQFTITNNSPDIRRSSSFFMHKVDEKRLDGLIIIDQLVKDNVLKRLKDKGFPLVLIDRYVKGEVINSVLFDNELGMYQAVKHLLELGHEKIGVIIPEYKSNSIDDLLRGYERALAEAGIPYSEELIEVVGAVQEAMERLLNLEELPTGVVIRSEEMAIEAMKAIKRRGLRIPEDISVISFNDTFLAVSVEPALTSVRVPLNEMGRLATEMLFELIEKGKSKYTQVVLKPELVIRDSCAKRCI